MNVAAHGVECLLEEAFDSLEVGEVALDDLDVAAGGSDGVRGLVVGGTGAANETDICAGFCERDGAGGTDTWGRGTQAAAHEDGREDRCEDGGAGTHRG